MSGPPVDVEAMLAWLTVLLTRGDVAGRRGHVCQVWRQNSAARTRHTAGSRRG